MTIAGDFAGSKALAPDIAATASTVLFVKKNGTQVGTITYGTSLTAPTLATSSGAAISLAVDDELSIIGPSAADTTLSGVHVVFLGVRA